MAKALGILLPLRRGNSGYFNQGFDLLTQVKSNLINLILTKKGERIMQPDFGCDVHRLVFEAITDDNIANIKGSITSAVKTWLPYLNILDVNITKDEDHNTVYAVVKFGLTNNPTVTDTVTLKF
jgi:uncharacterized protein